MNDSGIRERWLNQERICNIDSIVDFAASEAELVKGALLEAIDLAIKDREYFHAKLEEVRAENEKLHRVAEAATMLFRCGNSEDEPRLLNNFERALAEVTHDKK